MSDLQIEVNGKAVKESQPLATVGILMTPTSVGARRTLSDWARVLGLPYKALHTRIQTSGWPIEKAFTEPLRRRAAR